MTARVATAGTFNSGDLISAADINDMPGGTIGRDTLTGDSAGTSTTPELQCSESVSVGTDREITIMFHGNVRADLATGAFALVTEDGIQLNRKPFKIVAATTDTPFAVTILSYPAAGAHTYAGYTGPSGGGGATVTCSNDGYTGDRGVTQLQIIDSGPAF